MQILIFEEKHSDRFFEITASQTFEDIAKKIIEERIRDGWYITDEKTKARAALKLNKAAEFLESRSSYEYEGFRKVNTETI